ncbi:MAG: T9SS type A sorting domain-containing protein [bacterium]
MKLFLLLMSYVSRVERFKLYKIYKLLKYKKKVIVSSILLVISLFLIFTQSVFSIEAIHYSNPFAQITGIYDSPEHGLIIANKTGIFKVDKITKTTERIQYRYSEKRNGFQFFFEYMNEVHCYSEYDSLYRIHDGKLESVTDRVVAHLVKGEKLYLLKSKEPRIQVIENGIKKDFSTNDYEGMHLYANLIEINDDVYAYLGLNWSGYRFITKIGTDNLEYLMWPTNPKHEEFKDLFPSYIYNVNDDLWVKSSKGFYKMNNTDFEPIDTAYKFDDYYIYQFLPVGEKLYGINGHGIFTANIETKVTQYLTEMDLDYYHNMKIIRGGNYIYYLVDSSLYTYNPITEEFLRFQTNDKGTIVTFIEGLDEKLYIVKENLIEWYNNDMPVIFGEEGLYTNEFWDIVYDRFNNKVVALGLNNNNFLLQTFNGNKWDVIPVPLQANNQLQGATILIDVNLESDFNGNYFVSFEDYLRKYNGQNWEKISFLKNPEDSVHEPTEDYHALLMDSSGSIWISAYMKEYSQETGRIENYNQLFKFNNGFELIEDELNSSFSTLTYGICKKDGELIINTLGASLFSLKNGIKRMFIPKDGDQYSETYSFKDISQNNRGNLIVTFYPTTIWREGYGSTTLPGGISEYDGTNWEHDYYFDIADDNDVYIGGTKVIFDTYGYDYLISSNKFIRIGSDESISVFPVENLDLSFNYQIVQIENTLWITHEDNGLYKIDLPTIMSVDEKNKLEPVAFLKNEVISNDILELLIDIKEYEIYTIKGNLVAKGGKVSTVDVSNLSNGTYFIVCEVNGKPLAQKFIINR